MGSLNSAATSKKPSPTNSNIPCCRHNPLGCTKSLDPCTHNQKYLEIKNHLTQSYLGKELEKERQRLAFKCRALTQKLEELQNEEEARVKSKKKSTIYVFNPLVLVIGIKNDKEPEFSRVIDEDVAAITNLFRNSYKYHCYGKEINERKEWQWTRRAFKKILEVIGKKHKLARNDAIVIYISGHGLEERKIVSSDGIAFRMERIIEWLDLGTLPVVWLCDTCSGTKNMSRNANDARSGQFLFRYGPTRSSNDYAIMRQTSGFTSEADTKFSAAVVDAFEDNIDNEKTCAEIAVSINNKMYRQSYDLVEGINRCAFSIVLRPRK